jgi:hypothetical protein
LLAGCALLALPLLAAEPETEAAAAAEADYRERVQAIMRDAYLSRALDRSGDALVAVERADGSVMVDLQGTFQHAMLVRVNPDGTHEMQCHDRIEPAAEFLAGGADARLTGSEEHAHER